MLNGLKAAALSPSPVKLEMQLTDAFRSQSLFIPIGGLWGNGAVHSSCPRQITSFSLALRWVHFLDILQPRNTVTTFFLVTFSLKVFVTCVAVWNGVFPIALNVALLYLASPSVLVNMLASPHFSLKSWMSCLFSSYCVCIQVYWMLVANANSMFV